MTAPTTTTRMSAPPATPRGANNARVQHAGTGWFGRLLPLLTIALLALVIPVALGAQYARGSGSEDMSALHGHPMVQR